LRSQDGFDAGSRREAKAAEEHGIFESAAVAAAATLTGEGDAGLAVTGARAA
jgi:hypothetical protein